MGLRIGVGSDHAGKELKQLIFDFINMAGHEAVDYGVASDSTKSVDYPDYADILAQDLCAGKLSRGIAICGTGIGMSMVANKYPGVRAAVVWDEASCRLSRAHNDANVLCLGARMLNHHRAVDLVKLWLETPFEGERHQLRLNKMREIEKRNFYPR